MKVQVSSSLLLAAVVSAAVIVPRQSTPASPQAVAALTGGLESVAPHLDPAKVISLPSNIRAGSTRKTLRYGPFTLPAANASAANHGHGIMGLPQMSWKDFSKSMTFARNRDYEAAIASLMAAPFDPNGLSLVRSLKEGSICSDCTILAAKTDIVYENNTRADVAYGVYNHHINIINMGWKENYNWLDPCPKTFFNSILGSSIAEMIPTKFTAPLQSLAIGGVDEATQLFTSLDGEFQSGHYVDAKDKFIIQFEAINYKPVDQTVYIDLEYESIPGKVGKHSVVLPATATTCDSFIGFSGNGTAGSFMSREMRILLDGTIVAGKGHMHDGGVGMVTIVNGKPVCESKAIYGTKLQSENGKEWTTISKMTDCEQTIPVKKGDMIKMEVKFDEVNHPRRESHGDAQEEMGFMFYTFAPS